MSQIISLVLLTVVFWRILVVLIRLPMTLLRTQKIFWKMMSVFKNIFCPERSYREYVSFWKLLRWQIPVLKNLYMNNLRPHISFGCQLPSSKGVVKPEIIVQKTFQDKNLLSKDLSREKIICERLFRMGNNLKCSLIFFPSTFCVDVMNVLNSSHLHSQLMKSKTQDFMFVWKNRRFGQFS